MSPSEVAIFETVGKSGVANDRAGTLRGSIGALCLSYIEGKPKETSAMRHVATSSGRIGKFEQRMLQSSLEAKRLRIKGDTSA